MSYGDVARIAAWCLILAFVSSSIEKQPHTIDVAAITYLIVEGIYITVITK